MSIQNLVFDCGEVLLHFDLHELSRCFTRTEEDALLLRDAFARDWHCFDKGVIAYDDYRQAVQARLPERLRGPAAELQRQWFLKQPPIPGMMEFLTEMQQTYDCYILSNAPEHFGRHLTDAIPPAAGLKGALVSGEVQLMKPDEEIYRLFLRRFRLDAGECLFIDDKPDNVAAAEAVGMHGVLFDGRPETVRKRLTELKCGLRSG